MLRICLSPNVTMAAAQDDDDFGTFLAYSPTTYFLARRFVYGPPALQLPLPAPYLPPLSGTPPQEEEGNVIDSRSGSHDDAGPCSVPELSLCLCQQPATTSFLARSFVYVQPALQLPSPAPSLSPLLGTLPHLRNISSAGVGLASIQPQKQQRLRRYAPYKVTPPNGPLLSSTPTSHLRLVMEHPPPSV